ncbi:MAG TPA: Uma2 family endonuclease, partial [Gemmatimonadaceae bacterium]|nr:Uma2 family endonuclease [Gemmatimonadaceae bacterium]
MPAALDRYFTREEVLAFPEDGNRYELVHGELLVSPSPRTPHQRAVGDLYFSLRTYLARGSFGEVLMSPAD